MRALSAASSTATNITTNTLACQPGTQLAHKNGLNGPNEVAVMYRK